MAATIERIFKPNSVIDVGCGTGALLAQLKQNGLELGGLEYSDAGIARCRERGINVRKFDLEKEETIEGSWDLTVSFEVAEHLPESMADNYVRVISQFSPIVIMSAATIGQGGRIMSMSSRMNIGLRRCSGGASTTTKRLPIKCGLNGRKRGSRRGMSIIP